MRSAPWPVRSRTRGARTATGPMPVMISRSGRWPWRTSRRRPSSVRASEWPSRNAATLRLDRPRQQGPGAAAQHLGQRIGKRRWLGKLQNGIVTHGVSLLRWRSGGSITPTIRRLNPSPRHQLLAIAPVVHTTGGSIVISLSLMRTLLLVGWPRPCQRAGHSC